MFSLLSRRELYCTFSREEYVKVIDLLGIHKIHHVVATSDRHHPVAYAAGAEDVHAPMGVLEENPLTPQEYRIFVPRKEYALAQSLLAQTPVR
ncbi:MAG: hypothetical protein LBF64_01225 [Oscillospiraceae bacterium]|jgi:hypothetical protein|nr:hypothetical protein [Oscillospiraceae bacterium]